jgi:hypothetical protein
VQNLLNQMQQADIQHMEFATIASSPRWLSMKASR